jgi:hypothetical protein
MAARLDRQSDWENQYIAALYAGLEALKTLRGRNVAELAELQGIATQIKIWQSRIDRGNRTLAKLLRADAKARRNGHTVAP